MPDLSSFPITQRWPASHPDRLQLAYAQWRQVSIMLEETGLAYEPHLIDISNNESKDPAFVSGTDAYRRSSIRLALTETHRLMGIRCDPPLSGRQDGSVHLHRTRPALRDPSVGVLSDVGHRADVRTARLFLRFAGKDYEDKRPRQRFVDESGVFSGSWITGWRAANGLSMITRSRTLRRLAG